MYRKIVTEYWSDPAIEQMGWAGKYVMLYLLTSPLGNIAGCFVVTPKRIAKDTELDIEVAEKGLGEILGSGIAEYCEETHEILLKSWPKHNWNQSPNMKKGLVNAIEAVKCEAFRKQLQSHYEATMEPLGSHLEAATKPLGSSPTVTVTVTDSKGDRGVGEGEETPAPVLEIVGYLNETVGSRFMPKTPKTRSLINARLKEGYTVDDFKAVIDCKFREWRGGDMAKYLRPETLFSPKFEGYLNQARSEGARRSKYAKYA